MKNILKKLKVSMPYTLFGNIEFVYKNSYAVCSSERVSLVKIG